MITLPDWSKEYEPAITQQAYAKLKAKAEGVLSRLAKIYEAYEATGNDALIDSFRDLCDELHGYTSVLAYADPNAYWELSEKIYEKAAMLIELSGTVAPVD